MRSEAPARAKPRCCRSDEAKRPMIEPIEFAPVGDLPVSETERELQTLNVFESGPEILH